MRFLFFLFFPLASVAQLPQVSSGTLVRHANMPSAYVSPRHVDVWLPQGYSPRQKYAVLYMHDGQMLYDSTTTWNKQAWEMDDVLGGLLQRKQVQPTIVVGIWNSGPGRHADYFPQRPWEQLSTVQKDWVTGQLKAKGRTVNGFVPVSDNYLRFLVTELKPFIDSAYSTFTDPQHTFIAGSSMGGLISLYAICEYPQVFGGAACLSTHWPGVFSMPNNPVPQAFFNYLQRHLPSGENHRLYFDYGNQTLDSLYPPLQRKVDAIIKRKGYRKPHWQTRFFPGADHSERAWRQRLAIPLQFLLSP